MTWVLDLDGVIWLGDQPIAGSAQAVARLRAAGEQVLFATNNSFADIAAQEAKLAQAGIAAQGDVVTAAQAAARLLEPGQAALVSGGPGVVEALAARGVDVVDAGSLSGARAVPRVDAVVVGFHRSFDYERLRVAMTAIDDGARFLATNDDATYPTPDGPIPGGGAIVAAIAYAARTQPEVAGKPHGPMAELIRARSADGEVGIVVGDRPETDGAFARTLGWRFGLVLSGVTAQRDLPVDPTPDLVAEDLHHLVLATMPG